MHLYWRTGRIKVLKTIYIHFRSDVGASNVAIASYQLFGTHGHMFFFTQVGPQQVDADQEDIIYL